MQSLCLVLLTVVSQLLFPISAQPDKRSKPGASSLPTAARVVTHSVTPTLDNFALLSSIPPVSGNQNLYRSVASTDTVTSITTTIITIISDCGCAGPHSNTEKSTLTPALSVTTATSALYSSALQTTAPTAPSSPSETSPISPSVSSLCLNERCYSLYTTTSPATHFTVTPESGLSASAATIIKTTTATKRPPASTKTITVTSTTTSIRTTTVISTTVLTPLSPVGTVYSNQSTKTVTVTNTISDAEKTTTVTKTGPAYPITITEFAVSTFFSTNTVPNVVSVTQTETLIIPQPQITKTIAITETTTVPIPSAPDINQTYAFSTITITDIYTTTVSLDGVTTTVSVLSTVHDLSTFTTTVPPLEGQCTGEPFVTATTIPHATATSTASMTHLTLCPSRIINPTYSPSAALPWNHTWGCPPGTLCHPPQIDCNFEVGPPAGTYFCSPNECILRPELLSAQLRGPNVTSDSIKNFDISPGYFNLNPRWFDLSYGIFNLPFGMKFDDTARTIKRPFLPFNSSQPGDKHGGMLPVDPKLIPGVCYDECNDCMLEAESIGKIPALCAAGSAFEILLGYCNACIDLHSHLKVAGGGSITTKIPHFEQFLSYCDTIDIGISPPESASSLPSTTTVSDTTQASQVVSTSDPPSSSLPFGTDPIPTSTQSAGALSTSGSSQSATSIPPQSSSDTSPILSSLTSSTKPSSSSTSQAPAPSAPSTTGDIQSFAAGANSPIVLSTCSVPVMTSTSLTATKSSSSGGHDIPSSTSFSRISYNGRGSRKPTLDIRLLFLPGLLVLSFS